MRVTRRGMIVACLTGALLGLPVGVQTADAAVQNMRPCVTEDAPGPCFWDAATRGNRKGVSFWIDKRQGYHQGYRHIVVKGKHKLPDAHLCSSKGRKGKTCLHLGPWRPVKENWAEALAESGAKRATTRDWSRCSINVGPTTYAVCPDGTVEST